MIFTLIRVFFHFLPLTVLAEMYEIAEKEINLKGDDDDEEGKTKLQR